MTGLVTLDDLLAARQRIREYVVRTPLLPFPGEPLLIKPENLQVTGAFKLRGAFNKILSLTDEQRARGVVAHSSGNHAQAVAYAAKVLGVRAVVVMPQGAPRAKLDATRSHGAQVELVGNASDDRARRSAELAHQHGLTLVPPYDDPWIIAGAGTVGLEILEDCPQVRTVLVPVSGGGLISGVAAAIKLQRPDVRVIGVEPEHAADAQASLRSGQRQQVPPEQSARTIADGLRVQQVGDLNWAHLQAFVDDIVTVSDDDLRSAVRDSALRAHLVAEPSGAATLAAGLYHPQSYRHGEAGAGETVAVLSGGNLDAEVLSELLVPARA